MDTNPPAGASCDMPVLDYPFPSALRAFDLPSLFAGKVHDLLCRKYLKGRDWYDFIWHTARGVAVNHVLLSASLDQVGPWRGQAVTTDTPRVSAKFGAEVATVDWPQARDDVRGFLRPEELPSLELWSSPFSLNQCRKLA